MRASSAWRPRQRITNPKTLGVYLQAGMKRVEANIMSRVKKGKMKEGAAKAAMGLLTGTLTYDDFGSVDMVRRHILQLLGPHLAAPRLFHQ